VVAGSAFSVAQSLGASGVVAAVGTAGAVLFVSGSVFYIAYKLAKPKL
jgi:hypothetical protein